MLLLFINMIYTLSLLNIQIILKRLNVNLDYIYSYHYYYLLI